jgi:hypothetical protein
MLISTMGMDNIDHLVGFDFEYLLSLFEKARVDHQARGEALRRLVDGASGSP